MFKIVRKKTWNDMVLEKSYLESFRGSAIDRIQELNLENDRLFKLLHNKKTKKFYDKNGKLRNPDGTFARKNGF